MLTAPAVSVSPPAMLTISAKLVPVPPPVTEIPPVPVMLMVESASAVPVASTFITAVACPLCLST